MGATGWRCTPVRLTAPARPSKKEGGFGTRGTEDERLTKGYCFVSPFLKPVAAATAPDETWTSYIERHAGSSAQENRAKTDHQILFDR